MVKAVSRHGRGEPSSRLVFMTSNHREQIERSANTGERDVTRCCEAVSVSHECQPLSCKNKRSSRKAVNVSQTTVLRVLKQSGLNSFGACPQQKGPSGRLKPNSLYSFYVVSRNSLGSSLPSSVFSLNISSKTWARAGASSPPHQLTVEGKTTDSVDLQWNPPAIRHPEDRLSYSVHYQAVANETVSSLVTNVSSVTTELLSARLTGLTPGKRYRVRVIFKSKC